MLSPMTWQELKWCLSHLPPWPSIPIIWVCLPHPLFFTHNTAVHKSLWVPHCWWTLPVCLQKGWAIFVLETLFPVMDLDFSPWFRIIGCGWAFWSGHWLLQLPGLFGFGLSLKFSPFWKCLSLFPFLVLPLRPSLLSSSPVPWELTSSLFSGDVYLFFQTFVLVFHTRICPEDQ